MISLDKENQNQIFAFIPSIKNNISEWQIINFRFQSDDFEKNKSIFHRIVKIYDEYEGFYFLDNPKKGVAIVRLGAIENYTVVKNELETKLEKVKCQVLIRKMSPNGLKNLEINLSDNTDKSLSSALYHRREDREENVIIIADDDMFIRKTLKSFLDDHATVYEAEDGENILDLYMEKNPDLVILDIHMPKKDGLTLVTEINDLDSDAFIIISSSDAIERTILEAVSRGSVGFIVKPFKKEKVMEYINQCITLRTPEEQNTSQSSSI